jgi:hypothetical protein
MTKHQTKGWLVKEPQFINQSKSLLIIKTNLKDKGCSNYGVITYKNKKSCQHGQLGGHRIITQLVDC